MQDKEKAVNNQKAEAIKQAAFSLIVERGLCDLTTAMIAERAQASKGLIHYYYESKEKLIIEVMRSILERLLGIVKELLEQYSDNEERLEKGLTDFWKDFQADPSYVIVLFEAGINGRNSQELSRCVVEFHHKVSDELKEALLAGSGATDHASEKEAQAIVNIIFGVIESLTLQYILDPQRTDFEYTLNMLKKVINPMLRDRRSSP
jgi:AcrR family transcriptional regulator